MSSGQSLPFTSQWDQNSSALARSTRPLLWSILFSHTTSLPSLQLSVNKVCWSHCTGECSAIFWKTKSGPSSFASSRVVRPGLQLSWSHPLSDWTCSNDSRCQMAPLKHGTNTAESAGLILGQANRLSYSRTRALSAGRGAETLFRRHALALQWAKTQRAESSATPDNGEKRSLFTMATGANKAALCSHDACCLPDHMHSQFSTFIFTRPDCDSPVFPPCKIIFEEKSCDDSVARNGKNERPGSREDKAPVQCQHACSAERVLSRRPRLDPRPAGQTGHWSKFESLSQKMILWLLVCCRGKKKIL